MNFIFKYLKFLDILKFLKFII